MIEVYILYSKKLDQYYIGQSGNIDKRIIQHNTGITFFTSRAEDWLVVYKEKFGTRKEAMKREKEIKRMKSRKYIEKLVKGV